MLKEWNGQKIRTAWDGIDDAVRPIPLALWQDETDRWYAWFPLLRSPVISAGGHEGDKWEIYGPFTARDYREATDEQDNGEAFISQWFSNKRRQHMVYYQLASGKDQNNFDKQAFVFNSHAEAIAKIEELKNTLAF